jgi:hypothetical protein
MEKMILNDPAVYPSAEVLSAVLGESYSAFGELSLKVSEPPFGFTREWRFYKDGNSWLCKVTHGKKTIFWLSIWEGFFKTTFYFTEKTGKGIEGLEISEEMKKIFSCSNPAGRLFPLTIIHRDHLYIPDVLAIAGYKMHLK